MDLLSWLGANRSDTRRYREDSQRRQGGKDAVLCADQRGTLRWRMQAPPLRGDRRRPVARRRLEHAAAAAALSSRFDLLHLVMLLRG
jgi:hypothetical protein